jgi:hypothetical protein
MLHAEGFDAETVLRVCSEGNNINKQQKTPPKPEVARYNCSTSFSNSRAIHSGSLSPGNRTGVPIFT